MNKIRYLYLSLSAIPKWTFRCDFQVENSSKTTVLSFSAANRLPLCDSGWSWCASLIYCCCIQIEFYVCLSCRPFRWTRTEVEMLRWFSSLAHEHGLGDLFPSFLLANQCPWCNKWHWRQPSASVSNSSSQTRATSPFNIELVAPLVESSLTQAII